MSTKFFTEIGQTVGRACNLCGRFHRTSACPQTFPAQPIAVTAVRPSEAPGTQGWVCPACGTGNAPWRPQCGCQGREEAVEKKGSQTFVAEGSNKRQCDCCGLTFSQSTMREAGAYLACTNCFNLHDGHFDPTWHTVFDTTKRVPVPAVAKDGTPRRRYFFPHQKGLGPRWYFSDDPLPVTTPKQGWA